MIIKGIKNVLAQTWSRFRRLMIYVRQHPFKSLLFAAIAGFCSLFLFFLVIYLGAFGKLPTNAY